jgi:hypothetical protein
MVGLPLFVSRGPNVPTNKEEAKKICEITQRHGVTPEALVELTTDLVKEVGELSDNDSVKVTMRMLYAVAAAQMAHLAPDAYVNNAALYVNNAALVVGTIYAQDTLSKPQVPVPQALPNAYPFFLVVIVLLHSVYVCASIIASILAFCLQPWYIAFTVISLAVFLYTRRGQCILTTVENNCRRKLNMPEIDSFAYHYVGRPVVKAFNNHLNPDEAT